MEPTARLSRRQERSPRDMVLSLAVLLVPIVALLAFYRVVLNGDEPATVDPTEKFEQARRAAAFQVVQPRGLGADWHPASATFTKEAAGATLRIGYVGPGKDPVQLVESSVPPATLLPAELTKDAKPTGTVRADNGVWRLYDARPGERALVQASDNRTVVVVGRTDAATLEQLAATLS